MPTAANRSLLEPFHLHVADGTMYTGTELFAEHIDETVLWHSYEPETYWPNLMTMDALSYSDGDELRTDSQHWPI